MLKELCADERSECVKVVGVATDDPTQPFTHPNVRLWKYSHGRDDELLVTRFAERHSISLWTGRVKSPEFFELFTQRWTPELCLMAVFGQKIPREVFSFPELGFYNFHHSDLTWPSYPGPDPIAGMLRDGKTEVVLTMHQVSDVIDGGRFVARSKRFPLPAGVNAIQLHRLTWPQMARLFEHRSNGCLECEREEPAAA